MGFIKQKTIYDAGNTPIWLNVDRVKTAGGTLKTLPKAPAIIPAGTPAYLDKMGGEITLLETFRVAKDASASDTTVEVEANGNIPQITKGQAIMKAPSSYSETGTAIAAGDVTDGTDSGTKKFKITADALGALKVGDILVAASTYGENATIAVKPNGLIWHDLNVREGDYAQPGAIVTSGVILEDRISPVPDCVKAATPMITYEKEV